MVSLFHVMMLECWFFVKDSPLSNTLHNAGNVELYISVTLLYCMNGSISNTALHMRPSPLSFVCILTSAQTTASSKGTLVFRCSIAIPTAMLFTLRSIRYRIPRKTCFQCRGLRLTGWAFPAHYVWRPSGRTV